MCVFRYFALQTEATVCVSLLCTADQSYCLCLATLHCRPKLMSVFLFSGTCQETALHLASQNGRVSSVTLLLSMQARVERDKADKTFFDYVIELKVFEVAMAVVKHERSVSCRPRSNYCSLQSQPMTVNNCSANDSDGIACWLNRRTCDQKVASSNPGRIGGRIFFSRVNFVC